MGDLLAIHFSDDIQVCLMALEGRAEAGFGSILMTA